MRPQSAKAKGRRLQQIVAKDLLDQFPQLKPDDIRSTSMGAGGEDVLLSPAARQLIPYSFEAKNQERVNVWAALQQAALNTPAGNCPAVVIKKNNQDPHVILPWKHFVHMLGSASSPAHNHEAILQSLDIIQNTITLMKEELSKGA